MPSCLKSKADSNSALASHANSSTPSNHTKSTQPSCANSAYPPDKSAQVHVEPPVAEHTETPELIDQQDHIGSPASVATHDLGFNDLHTALSPAPSEAGDQEAWEIDDTLSPQECVKIGRQKLEYKRTRTYNIIQNKKSVAAIDLQVAISNLFKPDEM